MFFNLGSSLAILISVIWLTVLLRQVDSGVLRYSSTSSPTSSVPETASVMSAEEMYEDDYSPDIIYTVLTYFRPASPTRHRRSIGNTRKDQHAIVAATPGSVSLAEVAPATTPSPPKKWEFHDSNTILSYVSIHARNLMDTYWSAHVQLVHPSDKILAQSSNHDMKHDEDDRNSS